MPNELSLPTTGLDSREIARICGKRHDHVLRDIRAMLSALYPDGRGLPRFEETYVDEQNGEIYPCFVLPKREVLILASGYRLDIREKLVDRWIELESAEQHRTRTASLSEHQNLLLGWVEECMALKQISDMFGFSEGFHRAEALKAGHRILRETGINIIPAELEDHSHAPNQTLTQYAGTHAARVASGSDSVTVTDIARNYEHLTTTDVNVVLTEMGYQTRIIRGLYAPTPAGVDYCNTATLATGRNVGRRHIKGWDMGNAAFAALLHDRLSERNEFNRICRLQARRRSA